MYGQNDGYDAADDGEEDDEAFLASALKRVRAGNSAPDTSRIDAALLGKPLPPAGEKPIDISALRAPGALPLPPASYRKAAPQLPPKPPNLDPMAHLKRLPPAPPNVDPLAHLKRLPPTMPRPAPSVPEDASMMTPSQLQNAIEGDQAAAAAKRAAGLPSGGVVNPGAASPYARQNLEVRERFGQQASGRRQARLEEQQQYGTGSGGGLAGLNPMGPQFVPFANGMGGFLSGAMRPMNAHEQLAQQRQRDAVSLAGMEDATRREGQHLHHDEALARVAAGERQRQGEQAFRGEQAKLDRASREGIAKGNHEAAAGRQKAAHEAKAKATEGQRAEEQRVAAIDAEARAEAAAAATKELGHGPAKDSTFGIPHNAGKEAILRHQAATKAHYQRIFAEKMKAAGLHHAAGDDQGPGGDFGDDD